MCRKRRSGAFELPVPPQVSCPKCSCSLSRTVVQHFLQPNRIEGKVGSYFRRRFFVRTLNLTDGRLFVLVMGEWLRRRRRSHRASAEKK